MFLCYFQLIVGFDLTWNFSISQYCTKFNLSTSNFSIQFIIILYVIKFFLSIDQFQTWLSSFYLFYREINFKFK
jgi:hypothetical protein